MKHHFITTVLTGMFCATLFVAIPHAADGADWPMFHGPNLNNISPDTGLLKEWPEDGPKLLWKSDSIGNGTPAGYSSVIVAENHIFTTGTKGEDLYVFCLSMDGDVQWEANCGPSWLDGGKFPGARSTPTYSDGLLYVENPVGGLYCLDAKNGKEKWNVQLFEKYGAKNIVWALAESPLIDGNRVIVCPGGPTAAIVALDKKTGTEIWTTPGIDELTNYATPMIFTKDGLRILVTMTQKSVLGVNADTGEKLFTTPHVTKYDINATIPTYTADGNLYIISGYGTGSQLLKVTVDGKTASVEQVWADKRFDNQHGGIVVLDGYAYGTTQNYKGGAWVCQRLSDGELMWEERADSIGKGSCTYADGLIYGMAEANGKVGIFKATPEGHTLISSFLLPQDGVGQFWAHPVVIGGRLYLRRDNFLYCYDVKAK